MTDKMIATLADFSLRGNSAICSFVPLFHLLIHFSIIPQTGSKRTGDGKGRCGCDEREREIDGENKRDGH